MGGSYIKGPLVRRGRKKAGAYDDSGAHATRVAGAFRFPEVSRQISAETATLACRYSLFVLDYPMLVQRWDWSRRFMSAHRNAVTTVAPSGSFCETYIRSTYRRIRSIRQILPSVEIVEVAYTVVESLREDFWKEIDHDQRMTRNDWLEWISIKMRQMNGDGLEIVFEPGPNLGPIEEEIDDDIEDDVSNERSI